jgi:hypothetical protein
LSERESIDPSGVFADIGGGTPSIAEPGIVVEFFDFLTRAEPFHERELETRLVRDVEKFLLELGQGFAFAGRQYRLDVGDENFQLDLLFYYHLRPRAFVVIEWKKGKFKPEYAGTVDLASKRQVVKGRADGRPVTVVPSSQRPQRAR